MLNLVLSIIKHSKSLFNEGRCTESYQLIKKTHIYLKTQLQQLDVFTQDALIALIYNNIACIFVKQGKQANALKQIQKAIGILEKSDSFHQILYSQYNLMKIILCCSQLPIHICKKKIVDQQEAYIKLTRQHYKKKQTPFKQQILESMIVIDKELVQFKDLSWLESQNDFFRVTEEQQIVSLTRQSSSICEQEQSTQLMLVLERELKLDSQTLMKLLVEKSRKKLKQLSQYQKNNRKSLNNYRNKLALLLTEEDELETVMDLSQQKL